MSFINSMGKRLWISKSGRMVGCLDQIRLAVGKGSHSEHWTNVEWSWQQFVDRCRQTRFSTETFDEFCRMTKEQQGIAKNGPAFVGGPVEGGSRKKGNVHIKTMVVLDADDAKAGFLEGVTDALGDTARLVYGTHSCSPDLLDKMRVVVPLAREVNPVEYEAIARHLAAQIGMDYFDKTTFEHNRLFYFPSCPSDVDPFLVEEGFEPLDVDLVLGFYVDYTDRSQLPVHKDEVLKQKMSSGELGDPRKKDGIVGVFCTAYTISEGIETFLSDVYKPVNDSCTRYTYLEGTSFGGCSVHDDDLHFFSRHNSDPANTETCHNIFDLVRIHKFGALDEGASKYTNVAKMPSFAAMVSFAEQNQRCVEIKLERARQAFADDVETVEGGGEQAPAKALFFDGKRFVPKRLGDWFMTGRHAVVLNRELYVYDGGRYVQGEDLFRTICTERLGMDYAPNRIRDTLQYLLDSLKKYTSDDVLDTPAGILNVKNGLLDLDKFVLYPHRPDYISIVQLGAAYDPSVGAELFYEFLGRVVRPEEVPVVEEVLGSLLTPSMEYEKAVLFYGEGQNGKSTMSDLILRFLGSQNVFGASLQDLTDNRFAKAGLYGKMANIFPDESGKMIEDSKTFKTLVSGDNVNAEYKGKAAFTFKNRAKLIMSCNEIPKSRDKTDGNFRKYLIVEFPYKFDGKEIRRRLDAWADLPSALLNVAVAGLARLRAQGAFTETLRQKELISNLRADSDSVYAFFRDRVLVTDNPLDKVSVGDLREAYEAYCRDLGITPVGKREYEKGRARHLQRLEYDTNQGRAIKYIRLVNATDTNSFLLEKVDTGICLQ